MILLSSILRQLLALSAHHLKSVEVVAALGNQVLTQTGVSGSSSGDSGSSNGYQSKFQAIKVMGAIVTFCRYYYYHYYAFCLGVMMT